MEGLVCSCTFIANDVENYIYINPLQDKKDAINEIDFENIYTGDHPNLIVTKNDINYPDGLSKEEVILFVKKNIKNKNDLIIVKDYNQFRELIENRLIKIYRYEICGIIDDDEIEQASHIKDNIHQYSLLTLERIYINLCDGLIEDLQDL